MMKCAMFYGPGDVRIEDVPVPRPGPGEVLVRVRVALTCGTDVKTYNRGHPLIMKRLPSPFGHEFAGTVTAVGLGVGNCAVGDRVVAANSAPCHRCFYCKVGSYSMCEDLQFVNGAFAEYLLLPARVVEQNLYRVPDGVSFCQAALLEPLACVVHGIEHCDIRPADTVVVIGAGPIGLMFVRLATLRGARVVSVDRSERRLELARELGAIHTVRVGEGDDVVAAVREATDQRRGADVVVEAVGLPEVWESAVRMVRKAGTVLLFGGTKAGVTVTLDPILLHYQQLTLKGVFHHTPRSVRTAMELISQGQLDGGLFVSGEYPLERLVEALQLHGAQAGVKYAILP